MDNESQRLAQQTMAFVLAGGRGSRLFELTDTRAKPAMYFGGKSRIIHCTVKRCEFLHSPYRRCDPV